MSKKKALQLLEVFEARHPGVDSAVVLGAGVRSVQRWKAGDKVADMAAAHLATLAQIEGLVDVEALLAGRRQPAFSIEYLRRLGELAQVVAEEDAHVAQALGLEFGGGA